MCSASALFHDQLYIIASWIIISYIYTIDLSYFNAKYLVRSQWFLNLSQFQNSEGEFNWSPHLQAVLLGCFYYGYVATQLVGGYLSERVSAKLMMLVANLTGGVLYLLMPVMARWSVYALIVNRTLQGLFQVSKVITINQFHTE